MHKGAASRQEHIKKWLPLETRAARGLTAGMMYRAPSRELVDGAMEDLGDLLDFLD
jgi:hypothetical protein